MKMLELLAMPTTISRSRAEDFIDDPTCTGLHESLLRSYQTLAHVKEMLADGAPPKIVLEFLRDLDDVAPHFVDH